MPATITVTGTGDTIAVDGLVTLREAISSANSNTDLNADVVGVGDYGIDTINFNIAGTGVHTIQPLSQLPTITDPVVIDGYTQAGASPNSNGPGLGDNAVLQIELDGSQAGVAIRRTVHHRTEHHGRQQYGPRTRHQPIRRLWHQPGYAGEQHD